MLYLIVKCQFHNRVYCGIELVTIYWSHKVKRRVQKIRWSLVAFLGIFRSVFGFTIYISFSNYVHIYHFSYGVEIATDTGFCFTYLW